MPHVREALEAGVLRYWVCERHRQGGGARCRRRSVGEALYLAISAPTSRSMVPGVLPQAQRRRLAEAGIRCALRRWAAVAVVHSGGTRVVRHALLRAWPCTRNSRRRWAPRWTTRTSASTRTMRPTCVYAAGDVSTGLNQIVALGGAAMSCTGVAMGTPVASKKAGNEHRAYLAPGRHTHDDLRRRAAHGRRAAARDARLSAAPTNSRPTARRARRARGACAPLDDAPPVLDDPRSAGLTRAVRKLNRKRRAQHLQFEGAREHGVESRGVAAGRQAPRGDASSMAISRPSKPAPRARCASRSIDHAKSGCSRISIS
jgi:hypothetical protein